MRFLTPTEQRLLDALPTSEADVLQAFFDATDARLVSEGEPGPVAASVAPVVQAAPSPSETSQDALFLMHKKEARP